MASVVSNRFYRIEPFRRQLDNFQEFTICGMTSCLPKFIGFALSKLRSILQFSGLPHKRMVA